jgi:hypothetical protein
MTLSDSSTAVSSTPAPSEEHPVWSAHPDTSGQTGLWHVTVDEGWRTSVACSGMYEWAARWLVEELQGRPFAPGRRPR